MRAADVGENAHRLVLSGPAGGVIAAERLAASGFGDLITIDVGGTSSDLCLITDGAADVELEPSPLDLDPLRASSLSITAIGAGGGSIAAIVGGVLTVGPRSAGSEPGPVCYSRGGTEPTVTDAQAALGRLSPSGLLGGDMSLDIDAARRVITERLAEPLGLNWEDAALAVIQVANASMERGLRAVSVDAGRDPSDFSLVAYGGGGPLHACELAHASDIRTVLVPQASSAYSAVGLLAADLRRTFTDARPRLLQGLDAPKLEEALLRLRLNAASDSATGDVLETAAELRYIGQRGRIRVELTEWPLERDAVVRLADEFRSRHRAEYGHADEHDPIEIAALRVTRVQSWLPDGVVPKRRPLVGGPDSSRPVYFAGIGWARTPVRDRGSLGKGDSVVGPAIVGDRESTVVLPPGSVARIDGTTLVIEVAA